MAVVIRDRRLLFRIDVIIFTDSIPATCTGKCTGSAIVNAIGGILPYNYNCMKMTV